MGADAPSNSQALPGPLPAWTVRRMWTAAEIFHAVGNRWLLRSQHPGACASCRIITLRREAWDAGHIPILVVASFFLMGGNHGAAWSSAVTFVSFPPPCVKLPWITRVATKVASSTLRNARTGTSQFLSDKRPQTRSGSALPTLSFQWSRLQGPNESCGLKQVSNAGRAVPSSWASSCRLKSGHRDFWQPVQFGHLLIAKAAGDG